MLYLCVSKLGAFLLFVDSLLQKLHGAIVFYIFLEIILIFFNSPVCLFTRTLLFVNLVGFLVSLFLRAKWPPLWLLPVSFLSCVRLVVNGLVYLKGGHCAPRRVCNSTNKKRERERDLDVRSSSPIFHHQPMTADSIHADLFLSILFFFFLIFAENNKLKKAPKVLFFPVLQSHFVGYCVRM